MIIKCTETTNMCKRITILCLLITATHLTLGEDVLVEVPNGVIRGREANSSTGYPYYAFQKIPFAEPPVGDLRFKPPVPASKWDDELDATKIDVTCYQVNQNTDLENEDCLYLNVYTPQLPSDSGNVSLPVMLYIHGGGFHYGSILEARRGPDYLIDQEVIVVTIAYRLGPFGFLATGDTVIPGNNGLKDQLLAIQWTHDNIQFFGGDPEKITIFGESAGSVSVIFHLLNLKTKGLYRGAIAESGTAISPWAYQRNPREVAFLTAGLIDETFLDSDDSEALLDFLLDADAEDIDEASQKIEGLGLSYSPVIEPEHDDAYITKKMYQELKAGNFVRVPILIGMNSEERIYEALDPDGLEDHLEDFDKNLNLLVPPNVEIDDHDKLVEIGEAIRKLYTGGEPFEGNLGAGVRYYSDNQFTRSIIRHARLHAQYTFVYFYQFSYDGKLGNVDAPKFNGTDTVGHAEELDYLWRIHDEGTFDNSDLTEFPESDRLTERRMVQLWTNFAKKLHPTPEPSELLQYVRWPVVASGENDALFYIDIGEDLDLKNHPKKDTYAGWTEILDSLGLDDEFITY